MNKHVPVMINEVIQELNIISSGIYVDATLGGGGYSQEMAKGIAEGRLISFEIDDSAYNTYLERNGIRNIGSVITNVSDTHIVVNKNFAELISALSTLKIESIDGLVADLGWSSNQLDSLEGLSFSNEDADLDMRMNSESGVKASDLLNALGKKELLKIFKEYGDFLHFEAIKLVNAVFIYRKRKAFSKVSDLNTVVEDTLYKLSNRAKKNLNQTKARIFQALRIAVNSEYDNLMSLLIQGSQILNDKGKILIVTFHSGEEKVVKDFLKEFGTNLEYKTVEPSIEEISENKKARSAKLWVISK